MVKVFSTEKVVLTILIEPDDVLEHELEVLEDAIRDVLCKYKIPGVILDSYTGNTTVADEPFILSREL